MKPIFISINKIYYGIITVVCLGIIVIGTLYNSKEHKNHQVSAKSAISTIAEKPKPVDKKAVKSTKSASFKKTKSNYKAAKSSLVGKNISEKSKADKNSQDKLTAQNVKKKIQEVEKTFVAGISEDIFDNIGMDRDRTRDRQIELLREIINNPQSDKETRKKAQAELLFITTSLEKELETENVLKANGYKDSVVFIQESGITVLMKKVPQDKNEIFKIKDIVCISTGYKAEKVSLLGQSGK